MFLGAILTASFLPTSGILARELNFVSCEALPRQTYLSIQFWLLSSRTLRISSSSYKIWNKGGRASEDYGELCLQAQSVLRGLRSQNLCKGSNQMLHDVSGFPNRGSWPSNNLGWLVNCLWGFASLLSPLSFLFPPTVGDDSVFVWQQRGPDSTSGFQLLGTCPQPFLLLL